MLNLRHILFLNFQTVFDFSIFPLDFEKSKCPTETLGRIRSVVLTFIGYKQKIKQTDSIAKCVSLAEEPGVAREEKI